MTAIQDITANYRDALIARESDAEAELLRAYTLIWNDLEEHALTLAAQITAALEAGEAITPNWLNRQERYRILQAQVREEIARIVEGLGPTITQLQAEAVLFGDEMTRALLFEQGVRQLARLPNDQLIEMVGRLSNGSPLRDLLDELGDDASQRIQDALLTGLAEGQGPRVVARKIRDALGGNMARAMTISRTEVVSSYRRAGQRQALQYRHLLDGWVWSASIANRSPPPCASCLANHGKVYPVDASFDTHPRCRCAQIFRTKNNRVDFGLSGEEWFATQSSEYQQNVLAPSKYRAYQTGEIDLQDLIASGVDPKWGRWQREASLRQALRSRKARMFDQQAAD